MGMLHVFLGVNWYVELIASIRINIGATEAISEAGFECALCARAHTIFFHRYLCDTSFLGKTTFLNTFMTSKLILEHFWLLKQFFKIDQKYHP